jgi:hypothetical protein
MLGEGNNYDNDHCDFIMITDENNGNHQQEPNSGSTKPFYFCPKRTPIHPDMQFKLIACLAALFAVAAAQLPCVCAFIGITSTH